MDNQPVTRVAKCPAMAKLCFSCWSVTNYLAIILAIYLFIHLYSFQKAMLNHLMASDHHLMHHGGSGTAGCFDVTPSSDACWFKGMIWSAHLLCMCSIPVFRSICSLLVSALKGLLNSICIWKVCPLRMIISSPWYKSVWCSFLFCPVLELNRSTEHTDNFVSETGSFNNVFYYASVRLELIDNMKFPENWC